MMKRLLRGAFGLLSFPLFFFSCTSSSKVLTPDQSVPFAFTEEGRNHFQSLLDKLERGEELSGEESLILDQKQFYYSAQTNSCSWYCVTPTPRVEASSYLVGDDAEKWVPQHAHDFTYDRVWIAGEESKGEKPFLEYTFKEGSALLSKVIIAPGDVRDSTAWAQSTRPKRIEMTTPGRAPIELHLLPDYSLQTFSLEEEWGYTDREWTLRFRILEVYPSPTSSPVAISELFFDGPYSH